MYYGGVKNYDLANGPGVRVTLFVSGCRNACEGCFNPETWNFTHGEHFTKDTAKQIKKALAPDYVQGFTLLGGEPFEPENQGVLAGLLQEVRSLYPEKDIWCYTGYTYDADLKEGGRVHTVVTEDMLSCIDVLVDGPFVKAEHDVTLLYRGSRNQRLVNLKAMRAYRDAQNLVCPIADERIPLILWEKP